jgi:hypothetical protein
MEITKQLFKKIVINDTIIVQMELVIPEIINGANGNNCL